MAEGKQLRTDISQPDRQTYTVSNRTADRTINADSTTDAELADVLTTLIADLAALGLVDITES